MPQPAALPRPFWFVDFEIFASSLLGRTVSWAEIETRIQLVQQYSLIFEKWMATAGTKLLISVCWYDPEVLPATLAARRLGVVSADLQHGVQGNTHFAYSGWVKAPHGGYEVMPDVFLSWGNESAVRTLADNPAISTQSTTLVAGNLWFNKWRDDHVASCDDGLGCLKSKFKPFSKVILVTLLHGFKYDELFFDTIRHAPEDWYWLVRVHPGTPPGELASIKGKLGVIPEARFDLALSSQLPLYALLRLAHVHLTALSSTALEALGFGIPTITMCAAGGDRFAAFLDVGVMHWASSAEDLLHKIRLCETIPAAQCRQAAEEIFASSDVASNGLNQLLLMAGIDKH